MADRTPLYEEHVRLNARIVDFAGWDMPVQYKGVIAEHRAVRSSAGIFDVSHMGEIEITGTDALPCVQHLTTNDASKLTDGAAQYSLLCNKNGGIVDDLIVYRISHNHYMLVVNASNTSKDFEWCKSNTTGDVKINNSSDKFALIAFQGPKSIDILETICRSNIKGLPSYHFTIADILEVKECIIAKTGYTGEEGVEIFTKPEDAAAVWRALLDAGRDLGVMPAGLGARDTLRTEMKYSLYGHEIDDSTNPVEAGLMWVVKMKKDDFIGKDAIAKVKETGHKKELVGFRMIERGIPRPGYKILNPKGIVTSGTMSPSLNVAIGIGYIPVNSFSINDHISIDIRGKSRKAKIVKAPFYQR